MPTGTIAPFPKHTFQDNNGSPAAGYKLFTYAAGTSTKQSTYNDVGLSSANANPIVLDSAGRATIFLSPTSYKFILAPPTDTDPPSSPVWTVDNVNAVPASNVDVDVTGTAGENLSAGDVCFLSLGDGGLTSGRWYQGDADTDYRSSTAHAIGFATAAVTSGSSGTFRIAGRMTGLSSLSVGSVYYISATNGSITATAPTNRRRVGIADSTTTLVISEWLPTEPRTIATFIADASSSGAAETVLATLTMAAGFIPSNGMSIKGIFAGKTVSNANAKTVRIRLIEGGNNTVIASLACTVSEAGHWLAGFNCLRDGSTTGRTMAQVQCGPSGGPVSAAATNLGKPTLTWANAVEIRVTGQATTNGDVTLESGLLIMANGG